MVGKEIEVDFNLAEAEDTKRKKMNEWGIHFKFKLKTSHQLYI